MFMTQTRTLLQGSVRGKCIVLRNRLFSSRRFEEGIRESCIAEDLVKKANEMYFKIIIYEWISIDVIGNQDMKDIEAVLGK